MVLIQRSMKRYFWKTVTVPSQRISADRSCFKLYKIAVSLSRLTRDTDYTSREATVAWSVSTALRHMYTNIAVSTSLSYALEV